MMIVSDTLHKRRLSLILYIMMIVSDTHLFSASFSLARTPTITGTPAVADGWVSDPLLLRFKDNASEASHDNRQLGTWIWICVNRACAARARKRSGGHRRGIACAPRKPFWGCASYTSPVLLYDFM